jgi:hypothetical protein
MAGEFVEDDEKRIGVRFVDDDTAEDLGDIQIINISKNDQVVFAFTDAKAFRLFLSNSEEIMKHFAAMRSGEKKIVILPPFLKIQAVIKHEDEPDEVAA